jgi:hypothetical protein
MKNNFDINKIPLVALHCFCNYMEQSYSLEVGSICYLFAFRILCWGGLSLRDRDNFQGSGSTALPENSALDV